MAELWDDELEKVLKDLRDRKRRSQEEESRQCLVNDLKKIVASLEEGTPFYGDFRIDHTMHHTEYHFKIPTMWR